MLPCNCILLLDGMAFYLLMLLLSIHICSLNILFVIMKSFFSKIYVLFWKMFTRIFMDICLLIILYEMNKMICHIWCSQMDHCKFKDKLHISFHLLLLLRGLSMERKIYLLYLLLDFHQNLIKLWFINITINPCLVFNQILFFKSMVISFI